MKKLIAAALAILLGSTGYVIVDHTLEDRVTSLESRVSCLEDEVDSLKNTTYNGGGFTSNQPKYHHGDEATVKKFYRTDAGIKLVATNPKYDPFFFTPDEVNALPVQIIGKVVELRAKF